MDESEAVVDKETAKPPSPKPDTGDSPPPPKEEESHTLHGIPTTGFTGGSKRRRVGGNAATGAHRRAAAHQAPTNTAPQAGKKNVVLTGDAMKEMARQAKAVREERRSGLDARHKWIVAKVAHAMGVEQSTVEDQIVGDDRFELMDQFFAANGPKKLMFYYQDTVIREAVPSRNDAMSVHPGAPTKEKLFLTTGDAEPLVGICYFFVRTIDKPITISNIANEVNFGILDASDGNLLKGIENLLGKIMIPALQAQENWGRLKVTGSEGTNTQETDDFFESIEKFIATLASARDNMAGRFELAEFDIGYKLDQYRGPSDYMQAASSNTDMVEKLEGVLTGWSKEIEQVLAESEQMRKEADDIGPAAELDHWKHRMAKFSSLLDEIKTNRVS